MHPDGCKPVLSGGTVYIGGELFGTATEIAYTEEDDRVDFDQCAETVVKMGAATQSFSCTVEMASDAYMQFVHTLLGIDLALAEMCPNRRVVHLAKHAKKKRIRKKNYKRMIRICEKEKNHDRV